MSFRSKSLAYQIYTLIPSPKNSVVEHLDIRNFYPGGNENHFDTRNYHFPHNENHFPKNEKSFPLNGEKIFR